MSGEFNKDPSARSQAGPSTTALATTAGGIAATGPGAPPVQSETAVGIQQAVPDMLRATVEVYGDVVQALLSDLDEVSSSMGELGWLMGTRSLAQSEGWYQNALAQLKWWDSFLSGLPFPRLISDDRVAEIQHHQAHRMRVQLQASSIALAEHQRLVAAEIEAGTLSASEQERIAQIYDAPTEQDWRVDCAHIIADALAQLPPVPVVVPIVARDLDPAHHFSGYNAVQVMRQHPDLGARAQALDSVLATILQRELNLPLQDAHVHATRLTGMFWLALRRALEQGSTQLAASIQLATTSAQDGVSAAFSRELLMSWIHYLEQVPVVEPKRSIGQRLRGLLTTNQAAAPAAQAAAPRQITQQPDPDGDGAPQNKGVWGRLRGLLGGPDSNG